MERSREGERRSGSGAGDAKGGGEGDRGSGSGIEASKSEGEDSFGLDGGGAETGGAGATGEAGAGVVATTGEAGELLSSSVSSDKSDSASSVGSGSSFTLVAFCLPDPFLFLAAFLKCPGLFSTRVEIEAVPMLIDRFEALLILALFRVTEGDLRAMLAPSTGDFDGEGLVRYCELEALVDLPLARPVMATGDLD